MIEMRLHRSIAELPRADWDSLLGPDAPPFLSFTFLEALERTGCVSSKRGWLPTHLALWENDRLVAAAPAYLKGNSEGEFVFDFGWADYADRLNVKYYPKLVMAVPFTPATGSRVLVRDESQRERLVFALAEGLRQLLVTQNISSAHVLFLPRDQAESFERAGFAARWGIQYHWRNQNFQTFEDFLSTLPSKKRTQIRRERKEMDKLGIRIETLRGNEITPQAIDAMYQFYEITVDKFRWGRRYLNRAFFFDICERMRDGVEIVMATDASGRPVGGAFNLVGGDALYGRYWGATADVPFLHFNVCYYHSIEQCIFRKIARFEPGAGGEHKRVRGFDPTLTYSVHHLVDTRLSAAIREYLGREREHMGRVASGEINED
jgi:predicted N-acyltransferase